MPNQQRSAVPPLLTRVMRAVLRSPLHGMAYCSAMLITLTGQKSGKVYSTPISYATEGDWGLPSPAPDGGATCEVARRSPWRHVPTAAIF